jgi:hypothetical protein
MRYVIASILAPERLTQHPEYHKLLKAVLQSERKWFHFRHTEVVFDFLKTLNVYNHSALFLAVCAMIKAVSSSIFELKSSTFLSKSS